MWSKTRSMVVVLAIASLMLLPGGAMAGAPAGTGPWDAMAIDDAWHQIDQGKTQWYAFRYDGDEKQIEIKMDVEPNDGATFSVRTPEQAKLFQEQRKDTACGCSSANKSADADAFWAGDFNIPGTYYVVVNHTGHHATPAYYTMSIKGEGVSTPSSAVEAPAVAAAPEAAEPEEVSPFEDWMSMQGGHSHWETFRYDGKDTPIEITLDVEPNQGAVFSVWTPEQVKQYSQGGEVEPIGRGTPNGDLPGDLFWSGKFSTPGTYYVLVQHLGDQPSHCKLAIKGKDVWF